MIEFDPNGAAAEGSGIFALPYGINDAEVVVLPVPWDATSSQSRAAAAAPDAVLSASRFVELFDIRQGAIHARGIALDDADSVMLAQLNEKAIATIDGERNGGRHLTDLSHRLNQAVESRTRIHLDAGRKVGLLGGDHSVSYGSIAAHLESYPDLGVLQIDAHCDLRRAFDGMEFSHASIMYNVVETLTPSVLVQVGVRAICEEEAAYASESDRVRTFFDAELHDQRSEGRSWRDICGEVAAQLPTTLYVSVDIDGLDPSACPCTGTPVPGGLAYNDVIYLLRHIKNAGHHIVGFDLVEAAGNEFDANIAAHLLYQLCGLVADRDAAGYGLGPDASAIRDRKVAASAGRSQAS